MASLEILEPFAVISAIYPYTEAIDALRSEAPYAMASGGILGIPYLPALAKAGSILTSTNIGLGRLLIVTESNLRPSYREIIPPVVATSVTDNGESNGPGTVKSYSIAFSNGNYLDYTELTVGRVAPVVGDTAAIIIAKGFRQS